MNTVNFTQNLEEQAAIQILKNVAHGIALFYPETKLLKWCNTSFKKQTFFGRAGRNAKSVSIEDLFDHKDHKLINDLFDIALNQGQAYDYQKMVCRGPIGSFPAEVKFRRIEIDEKEIYVCLEVVDLSLTKLYDELQETHAEVRNKMVQLMDTQAELQHSVRMNTISEIGADLAHQLINPITMVQGIIKSHIAPHITEPSIKDELNKVMKYVLDLQEIAVWFRKFSNPNLANTQIVKISSILQDVLMINVYRFTTEGITYKIRKDGDYDPSTMTAPISLIMWINACFNEILQVLPGANNTIYIDIQGNNDVVSISIQSSILSGSKKKIKPESLEKLAAKLPGQPKFEYMIQDSHCLFNLTLNVIQDAELKQQNENGLKIVQNINENKKTVLIVDDESDIRRLVKRTLKQIGFDVVEAEDGQEALEYFVSPDKKELASKIGVIVCDVRMPKMTGPHFLVALREEKNETPFIFFSSNLVDKGDNGLKYQNVYYLTKESGLEELKKMTSQFLPKIQAAS